QGRGGKATPTPGSARQIAQLADLRLAAIVLGWICGDDSFGGKVHAFKQRRRADDTPEEALPGCDLYRRTYPPGDVRMVHADAHLEEARVAGIGVRERLHQALQGEVIDRWQGGEPFCDGCHQSVDSRPLM